MPCKTAEGVCGGRRSVGDLTAPGVILRPKLWLPPSALAVDVFPSKYATRKNACSSKIPLQTL